MAGSSDREWRVVPIPVSVRIEHHTISKLRSLRTMADRSKDRPVRVTLKGREGRFCKRRHSSDPVNESVSSAVHGRCSLTAKQGAVGRWPLERVLRAAGGDVSAVKGVM